MKRKHFISVHFIGGVVTLISLLCQGLYAQNTSIQLINKNTGEAVVDVYFQYNSKTGLSNSGGEIVINYNEGKTLFLSHLQFGKLQIPPDELKLAVGTGRLLLSESSLHLLPVTLVQVRHAGGEPGGMDISLQNKLEHDAGNLLEEVAGISSIRKSAAYGFDPVLRGFKYDQINLVLDGVQTASAACPNRMDPAASQIPINMITEAEVLKGPHSLRFGNTFGGVINFKSAAPVFTNKTTPFGRVGTSFESNGNIYRTEAVAGLSGSQIDFKLFGAYSEGADYTDGDGMAVSADFNRLNWGGKLGVKLSNYQSFGVLVSNNYAKDVDFPALPMDLREDNTWLINASHSLRFVNKSLSVWNTSLYGTKVSHLMDNYDKPMDPRKVDAITDAKTKNYGGRTEMRFDVNTGFLYAGLDYRYESADGIRTRTILMGPMEGKVFNDNVWQDAQIIRTGVFGEYHLDGNGFQLVLSGRLDFNSANVKNPAERFKNIYDDLESSHVHPSFSVGGTKLFDEYTSVGLWYGRATRSAAIAERYINQFPIGLDPYEMLGNPQLDPEINNQLDLVFQYKTERSNLSLNLFSSFLRDYISSEIREELPPAMPASPGVRQFVNIEKAFMSGFEALWRQNFAQLFTYNLSLVYTYGQNKGLEEPLAEIPPFELRYSLMARLLKNKLHPEMMFRYAAKQNRIANSYGETITPGFTTVDAKADWMLSEVVTLSAGVQNIFDVAYYEHLARSVRSVENRPIYSPGRSFYATLTINFM